MRIQLAKILPIIQEGLRIKKIAYGVGFLQVISNLHNIGVLYGLHFSCVFDSFLELFGKLSRRSVDAHNVHLRFNDTGSLTLRAYHLHIETVSGSPEDMDILFGRLRTALLAGKMLKSGFDDVFYDEVVHKLDS